MSYNNILDMHAHSDNSFDGEDAMIYVCECAQSNGIRAVAFTDHCEVDNYKQDKFAPKVLAQSYFEALKSKLVYEGSLIICSGIELGQPTFDEQTAEKIISRFNYDIVLASIHNLRNKKDFYFLDYTKENIDELLTDYFTEMLEIAKWNKFDSLAHLTYPLRYIKGKYNIDVDLKAFSDYTDEIFKTLAQNGKALEINTSGLRQSLGDTMPSKDLISRYKELGGELITIGSDSHRAKDIGAGVEQAMSVCADCGFKYVALYQSREPVMISIENSNGEVI